MKLEDRINANYKALTSTDKDIFKVILSMNFNTQSPTVQDVADNAHVSTASVHRAIKKVGYKAYTHFKYEMSKAPSLRAIHNTYGDFMIDFINQTITDYDKSDHLELYEKLNSARNIYVYGTGNEQQSALQTFSNHFIYYGKPLITIQTLTDLDIYSRKMTKDDVVFICSLKGMTESYHHILHTLEMKRTYLVSITSDSLNQLSQVSNHSLYFHSDFHHSTTNLHWPSITLRVLLDKLIYEYFLNQSKKEV